MTNREQRDWIWKRYEEVRDMAYDMACADAERLTREAAETLKAAHKALLDAEKQSLLGRERE